MIRPLKYLGNHRDLRMVGIAGVLGLAVTLASMVVLDAYFVSQTAQLIGLAAVIGSLAGVCVAGAATVLKAKQKLSKHISNLDVALNNMIQGLCMFDAQN